MTRTGMVRGFSSAENILFLDLGAGLLVVFVEARTGEHRERKVREER